MPFTLVPSAVLGLFHNTDMSGFIKVIGSVALNKRSNGVMTTDSESSTWSFVSKGEQKSGKRRQSE